MQYSPSGTKYPSVRKNTNGHSSYRGAGYIGSQTVLELVDAGEAVVVLDNLSTGFRAAVSPRADLIVGDIGNLELLASIFANNRIDAIIHFAGSTVVSESIAKPLDYYDNNTCKTLSLIGAAVEGRVPHFIFSSTAAVYGAGGLEPVREDSCVRPESPYGRFRLALTFLWQGGQSLIANCGYSRGCSVLEILDAVQRVNGRKLDSRLANRRLGDPVAIVADLHSRWNVHP
jgi:UDP-glucose 4-epimerase